MTGVPRARPGQAGSKKNAGSKKPGRAGSKKRTGSKKPGRAGPKKITEPKKPGRAGYHIFPDRARPGRKYLNRPGRAGPSQFENFDIKIQNLRILQLEKFRILELQDSAMPKLPSYLISGYQNFMISERMHGRTDGHGRT